MEYQAGDFFVYSFTLQHHLRAPDDTPVSVEIGNKHVGRHIVSTRQLALEIASGENYGLSLDEARIEAGFTKTIELLCGTFLDSKSAPGVRFQFSDRLFSGTSDSMEDSKEVAEGIQERPLPHSDQKDAIRASCTKSLTVIRGPLGTGKTRTLAVAVAAHAMAGRTVLMVAHANAAVDVALAAVAEELRQSLYKEGKILQLGTASSKRLEEELPQVIPDRLVGIQEKSLLARKQKLRNQAAQFSSWMNVLKKLAADSDTCHRTESRLSELAAERQMLETLLQALEGRAEAIGQEVRALHDRPAKVKTQVGSEDC